MPALFEVIDSLCNQDHIATRIQENEMQFHKTQAEFNYTKSQYDILMF